MTAPDWSDRRSRNPAWQDRAACRNSADDETLFPDTRSDEQDKAAAAAARELYCGGCPVRAECLGYALASGGLEGVWGGVMFRGGLPRDAGLRHVATRPPGGRCRSGRHRRTPANTRTYADGCDRCLECKADRERYLSKSGRAA